MSRSHPTIGISKVCRLLLIAMLVALLGLSLGAILHLTARAATPGLPFTEDFVDDTLRDSNLTNANWSTEEQALVLAWRRAQYGAFGPSLTASDITSDTDDTWSMALGDVDGDGDLDLVAGSFNQANRLYLNNGTATPFSGVSDSDVTTDTHATYSVALGDMDGDGDLDLVAGNNGRNRLYLNNGTASPFGGVTGSDITADPHWSTSVALGDVDGDGDLDLVAGNFSGQANRLYLNNGTSSPFTGVSGSDITTDTDWTRSVALGDVDGDGDLDLVAGNYGQANRLYLNNGTATPFRGVSGSNVTPDAHNTASVALGDVDGDGDLDLAVGNDSQANRLYLNNGTTSPFSGASGSNVSVDTHSTSSLALGDVDGDGDLDLIAGNIANQVNRLYLNDGSAAPFSGVTGSDVTTDAHVTNSVALGDVDRDGDLDLLAGNYGQANRLYLNDPAASPFSGVSGTDITTDTHATFSVALGDVDGDGDLDLVAANTGNQANRLYLNNGTGSPFSGVTGSDVTTDAHSTLSVALGDVDGDGDLDLVAGNPAQANRLYLNNGTPSPFTGVSGSDITADAHDTWSVALGDMDGDGDLDLVAGNTSGQMNRLYLNNGTAAPFSGVTGSVVSTDHGDTTSVALGDMDGDGDLDVVTGNVWQVNRMYLNNGTAAPFSGVTGSDISADAHWTYSVALGDVDGDGDLDLIAGNSSNEVNRMYLNNGTANPFTGVTGSDVSGDAHSTKSVALADVDGDGDLDLVAGNQNQPNRMYLNNGTTTPFTGVSGNDVSTDTHETYSVALGDVDGDGDLDLVAGNLAQINRLYLNGATPHPRTGWAGSDVSTDTDTTLSVALGDVDRDGDLDLVAGNQDQPNRLYLNNGTSTPFNGVTGSDISADTDNTWSVALGDVDRDGDLDLVVGNRAQPNRLYLNNGTATPFNGVTRSDISSDAHATYSVALGDVDRDGDLDLVAGNNGRNRLYLNNGTPIPFDSVTSSIVTADAHDTRSLVLGDVDGDGDLDLLAGNTNGQTNRLYLNNGTSAPFTGVTGSDISSDTDDTWSVALGDVDGDGDLDLVAGNDGQANRLYLNNGTAAPFTGVTGTDVSADIHNTISVALGDVDRDGDLDLIAGNSYQANRLHLNNGTSTPFNGVTGSNITSDSDNTRSVALGDVDRDGGLDVAAGNRNQANRLYRRMVYHTGQGRAGSLEVDTETTDIDQAMLFPTASLPANTEVTYWLSNNGGDKWFIVRPHTMFVFPTAGTDLRWRAELHSLSPARTPRIDQISIAAQVYYLYLPLVLK